MNFAPQGSGAWLNARVGNLTASNMAKAMSFLKPDKQGNVRSSEERNKLIIDIVAQRMTGDQTPNFVNDAMRWGIEYEPHAKATWQAKTGMLIEDCGFILHPTIEHFGASPDGFVAQDTVIEIKCPTSSTHVGWLMKDEFPAQHKPQVLAQLACTGRTSAILVSYDPRMPFGQRMATWHWTPAEDEIKDIEAKAQSFLYEVEQLFAKVTA